MPYSVNSCEVPEMRIRFCRF